MYFVSPPIVRNGLVFSIDPAAQKSYPGTGTIVNDLSGQGNHGTLTGGVGYSTGNAGSFVLNGTNGVIAAAHNATIEPLTGSFTVALWIKINGALSNAYHIFGKGAASADNIGYGAYFSVNRLFVRVNANNGTQRAAQSLLSFTQGGAYFHLTMVIDRGQNIVLGYLNGTNEGWANGEAGVGTNSISGFNSITAPTHPFVLGRSAIFSHYLNGNIGAVHIYNRALSAAEVKQNFEAQRSRYGV